MLQELRYRGPDAAGSHFDRGVALGHRRLAVIDLQGGRQPMTDPSQRFTLSFNGEIYNFAEVRESLEATGVRFATRSDTEVILLGYRAWGPAVLDRLVGMFALAIWDREHETLFLARDRLGVKPLYWARVPRVGFVFASELSAVLASEMIRRRLDPEALGTYLANGYVVGESSLIAGVHRLPAGHTLCWRRGGEPQCRRYWDIGEAWRRAVSTPVRDPSAALEGFAERLRTAVRQRLVSDVPLGAFLSGGLDSSTIVALMKEQQAEVRTFSIGFREASYDELPWARRVAQHLGTRHSETVVSASAPELLEELSAKLDEPFADTSIVPTYALCRESRRQVTVALSGDGADELLAGYVTHIATDLQRKLHRVPGWARRLTRAAVARVPDSRRKVSWTFRLKQFARGLGEETWAAHAGWRVIGTPAVVASLLQGQVQRPSRRPIAEFERAYREVPDLPELDRLLIGDYRTWLVDDILCKVDRASAGCGLEVRSPFLDHRLVEYCAGLPPGLKLQGRRGKIVLRHFAAQHLPPEILQRKKAGFNAPVSHWLATSWRLIAEDVFAAHRLGSTGVLEPRAVRTLWEEHTAGRRDHGYLLFALLMLGLWLDRFRPSL
jgi:asparagine synthase (glutamine-hydrolysing)